MTLTLGGIALCLVLISGWLTLPFSLLQGPLIYGEIFLFTLLFFLFWNYRSRAIQIVATTLLIATPFWFFDAASGRTIFSDDHATFLSRLILLKEHFPHIPFYNPLWNGGIDARDFFATGALNIFFLASPLIYLMSDLHEGYNFIIAFLMFVVLPGSSALAAYLYGMNRSGILLSALLASCSSLLWFRWAYQFGTLGFVTSSALLPLVLACASRFFEDRKVTFPIVLLSLISGSLILFWTPAGLVCLPVIFIGFCFLFRLLRQRWWLPTVALLIAIHIPWISLFWSVSKVNTFLDSEKKSYSVTHELSDKKEQTKVKDFKHQTNSITLKGAWKHIREVMHSANPLLWCMLIPGLLLLPRWPAVVIGATLLWLITIGSIGPLIKPQLELDRMLVILVLLGAIPSAKAIESLLEQEHFTMKAIGSLSIGFAIAGVFSGGAVIQGRTVVPITFENKEVIQIAEAAKQHAKKGRVLFSGFMLHDYSGGHLAPLPLLASDTPIIASSPVHNLWRYQQVFPKDFVSRKDEGITEYLDLMNVSTIFAHEPKWREYFQSRSDDYQQVGQIGRFKIFTRNHYPESYFLKGNGQVLAQDSGSATFRLNSEEAVLRFQWFPFIHVKGCKTTPYRASKSLTFIKVSNCLSSETHRLESVNPVERWKLGYFPNNTIMENEEA